MAKCISCGAEIPEGAEYCEECLSKLNTAKDSESYLDSLLNAVMTEQPERREIVYPKKEASSLVSMSKNTHEEPEESASDELVQEFFSMPEEKTQEIPQEEAAELREASPVEPVLEDLFGSFFDSDMDLPELENYDIFGDVDEGTINRMLSEDLEDTDTWEDDSEEEVRMSEVGDIEEVFGMLEDERGAEAPAQVEVNENPEVISAADFDAMGDMFSGIVDASEEEVPEEETLTEEAVTEFGDFADLFADEVSEPEEEPVTEFGDFAALFADEVGEPKEEPVPEFGDFAELFAGEGEEAAASQPEEQSEEQSEETSVEDFFDLFGSEEMAGMFDFGTEPLEVEDEVPSGESETKAAESNAKSSGKKDKKEKKQGGISALYHKLFDNVKVDPSKIKKPPTKEELEAQKKAKQEAKEREKEEKEALLAEKKNQKKQEKLEKQRVKREVKAEKKARKLEEAKLLLEEMESTRINRAGASIVFIFFAMIAVVIVVGTSIFSYSLSIRNAEYEFNRDEYTLAYNEIYGLEIKQEDYVLYDRIMTVMYVQKQLNSYYNYYGLNDKPKALDSLLKGLQRYEKYIELAVDLEVDSDLDSVRKKILTEIDATFTLTEQEAMEIIQSDSQAEYSKKVYDAVDRLE